MATLLAKATPGNRGVTLYTNGERRDEEHDVQVSNPSFMDRVVSHLAHDKAIGRVVPLSNGNHHYTPSAYYREERMIFFRPIRKHN